tara:strand:- start:6878 stop:7594 length:717 start_codon:yes stop_codon:yes gene_type:complete
MKKIYLIFILLGTLNSTAQPFDLIFDHPWYLFQMQIDGSNNQIPYNSEVSNAILNFYDTTPYTFSLEICQTISGEITYPNFDTMSFLGGMSITGNECTIEENLIFETTLFDFLQSLIDVELVYDYTFVDPDPPNNILTIYAPNGNFIVFTEVPNPILSLNSFDQKIFAVYPNPVSEVVTVKNLHSQNLSEMRLLSIQGANIMETPQNFLNIAHLSKGIYLLELIAEDGSKQVEKIIKK